MKIPPPQQEFESFITASEVSPSIETTKMVLNQARDHMCPSTLFVSAKYGFLFVASVFLSLSLCPQSGVSFLREDFPLFHHFFHQNILLCGVYCATVFFCTTHLVAFLLLHRFERKVFSESLSFLPIFPLAISFGAFMLLSPQDFAVHFLEKTYVVSWLTTMALLFLVWKQGLRLKLNRNNF